MATKKKCTKCGVEKYPTKDFYTSNSSNYADKKYPVCKACLLKKINITENEHPNDEQVLKRVQEVLLELNRPFMYLIWEKSIEESEKTKKDVFGMYMKNIALSYKKATWKDSEFNSVGKTEEVGKKQAIPDKVEVVEAPPEEDNQNKNDVLRMLGYNPFEFEPKEDQRHLFNKLVDFLDEGTLEDSFKLPAVIEIVKSFNQLDKINNAISRIMSDVDSFSQNVGSVNSLVGAKDKMLKSVLALAKDNGISVNHNNNKSKGAGTLSGIIKTLQEKGFEEAAVNLFDIETAQGMRQVADLSNQSIMNQLQFDENDYTSMIMEQRELLQKSEDKVISLEEENRKLKKELMSYKRVGDIDG